MRNNYRGLIKHLTTNNEKVMVNRVDTVIKEVAPAISQTIRDTIIVEKTIPLRVDTIVKIKEIVPPEYVEIINKEKEEQQRKDRVKVETEKMLKYIDKEWAEYEKEIESGRPEYLYLPRMMALLKSQRTMLSLIDKMIELKFTIEEYYYVSNYSSSYSTKYKGTSKDFTTEELSLMRTLTDSLQPIFEKQADVFDSKVMVIMGGYQQIIN